MKNKTKNRKMMFVQLCQLSPEQAVSMYAKFRNLSATDISILWANNNRYDLKRKVLKWLIRNTYDGTDSNYTKTVKMILEH